MDFKTNGTGKLGNANLNVELKLSSSTAVRLSILSINQIKHKLVDVRYEYLSRS